MIIFVTSTSFPGLSNGPFWKYQKLDHWKEDLGMTKIFTFVTWKLLKPVNNVLIYAHGNYE